jgi:hypothetical protein
MKRYYEGDVITVVAQGLFPIDVTPEHPVLVCHLRRRRHWTKTSRIRPRPKHDHYYVGVSTWERDKPSWKPARELIRTDFLLIPRRSTFGKFNDLTLAWLMGLFIAEGWITRNSSRKNYHGICFSLGKHETELTAKTLSILKTRFDRGAISPQRTANRVYAWGNDITSQFLQCYKDMQKRVPQIVMEAAPEVVRAFLEGLAAGDGYQREHSISVSTSSRCLAHDLIELLTSTLGILPYLETRYDQPDMIERRKVCVRPSFRVAWRKNAWHGLSVGTRYVSDREYVYVPVKQIRHHHDAISVYNLTTPSETYCVPFIVHNCTGFLGWEKQLARTNPRMYRYVQKLRGVRLVDDFLSLEDKRLVGPCMTVEQKALSDWF